MIRSISFRADMFIFVLLVPKYRSKHFIQLNEQTIFTCSQQLCIVPDKKHKYLARISWPNRPHLHCYCQPTTITNERKRSIHTRKERIHKLFNKIIILIILITAFIEILAMLWYELNTIRHSWERKINTHI